MLEHSSEDMYACTLYMVVLHNNEHMVIVNTNNEVACQVIDPTVPTLLVVT